MNNEIVDAVTDTYIINKIIAEVAAVISFVCLFELSIFFDGVDLPVRIIPSGARNGEMPKCFAERPPRPGRVGSERR
jgi:hypothetical protein